MTVRIRAKARRDLEDILEYSAALYGDEAAERYVRAIGEAMERLRQHPEIGVPRPELGAETRSYPAREHRLIYDLNGRRVSILRVLHKAMDPARHL